MYKPKQNLLEYKSMAFLSEWCAKWE